MLKIIDNFLDRTTMYRLVLYYLLFLLYAGLALSLFGKLPYTPNALIFSTAAITALCLAVNAIFAKIFKVHANVESAYITALILVLIISPAANFLSLKYLSLIVTAPVLAMASKYILAINKKHLFNPVALAAAATALLLNQSASWWISTAVMLPFVLLGGVLMAKKLRRWGLVLVFFAAALVSSLGYSLFEGFGLFASLGKIFLDTPLFFFAFIMLTEPMTTPPTKTLQLWYGALVGFLFAPWVHLGAVYSTPELSLLAGNVFSYLVSPKQKLVLTLKSRVRVARDTYSFVFAPSQKLIFAPGQYLEWTLDGSGADNRGNRRYFTIASSPTENTIDLGIKFYPKPSSYKKMLASMQHNDSLIAGQLAGDFTLPKDKNKKLVFLAGGIGVTPFRSMIKYLLDKGEKRPIIFFYSNKTANDIAYKELFNQAAETLDIKTLYTLTDAQKAPAGWTGHLGLIDEQMVRQEVPDYQERMFYLSGPQAMVTAFDQMLRRLGVPERHIVKDFFPGFA